MTREIDPATGYPRYTGQEIVNELPKRRERAMGMAEGMDYLVKDSGRREEYASGMRRDVEDDKIDYTLVYDGPLLERLAAHLTKGAVKYGRRNWQLAESLQEAERFQRSAARHFHQWLRGELDEDHMAAVTFNLNACEYVLQRCGYSTVQRFRENMEKL